MPTHEGFRIGFRVQVFLSWHNASCYEFWRLCVSGLVFMDPFACLHVCPFTPTTHKDAEVPSGHRCQHSQASVEGLGSGVFKLAQCKLL